MTDVTIVDIATANPLLRLTQEDILERILKAQTRTKREKKLYSRFLSEPSIKTRYVALDQEPEVLFEETQDMAIARFEVQSVKIGTQAILQLLKQNNLDAKDIDALIITTCTGYLCPGLTSSISQSVGLKEDIHAVDMVGTGCGAALPAMKAAWQFLKLNPESNVVVLAVEICTATSYWAENMDLIISNSIFGDGAAACLLTNKKSAGGLELKAFKSLLWPQYRNELRYVTKNGRLLNVLDKQVPSIAAKAFDRIHQQLVSEFKKPIEHFAVHPGGRKILDEIQGTLVNEPLTRSREVLSDYGNMSSPSVLYVLKNIMQKDNLKDGSIVGIFAFGAGLTAFGAVTQFKSRKEAVC